MIEIIVTEDGSHTLRDTELEETYHSIHGAIQESLHVFIKNGLDQLIKSGLSEISILEVGFGTGLNAWLTLQRCKEIATIIKYSTLEPFPLNESIWTNLNYASAQDRDLFMQLHRASWNTPSLIIPNFELRKIDSTLQQIELVGNTYDLIYFDAFAPDKQLEMWQPLVLNKISAAMKSSGILVTYCAKGQVKRDLKSAGLSVEKLPGPPGKREMIRALKPE